MRVPQLESDGVNRAIVAILSIVEGLRCRNFFTFGPRLEGRSNCRYTGVSSLGTVSPGVADPLGLVKAGIDMSSSSEAFSRAA